ncbi:MAG TPA: VOC family protein [Rhizobiaceae bacterium]|nr:VOC family protein [Rhizobiaceae bacterium]
MVDLPFAVTTPIRVARVGLKARDADGLAAYYQRVLGLRELSRAGGRRVLGAGQRPLMEIEESASAKQDDPHSAGLYHTAFLLPTRGDLARWTRFAIDERIPVAGASDHFVSEAIYLTDPEGNGVEIYADRPKESWNWHGNFVDMGTEQLDVRDLLGETRNGEVWQGAPDGSVIGHVHLRVGDAGVAEKWWTGEMGFDTVQSLGGSAVFLSTGGYHHHIGANSWQSHGAGPRNDQRAGLMWVELESEAANTESEKRDPWGTAIRTVPVRQP